MKYTNLDKRIEETYVAGSKSTNKNSLYDSYIRAFRWASDRIREKDEHGNINGGVSGFISNGGWLDGNAAAGFRKCLEQEFTAIYVLHLRGDQRTSGELSRREGGKIFGSGSRAPVVITILTYNPKHQGKAKIYFHDIGDYLTREKKLEQLTEWHSIGNSQLEWTEIEPNEHGDWINQRSNLFGSYIIIGDKSNKSDNSIFFNPFYSRGLETSRDAWVYNFYSKEVLKNIKASINFFNLQCENIKKGFR